MVELEVVYTMNSSSSSYVTQCQVNVLKGNLNELGLELLL